MAEHNIPVTKACWKVELRFMHYGLKNVSSKIKDILSTILKFNQRKNKVMFERDVWGKFFTFDLWPSQIVLVHCTLSHDCEHLCQVILNAYN